MQNTPPASKEQAFRGVIFYYFCVKDFILIKAVSEAYGRLKTNDGEEC